MTPQKNLQKKIKLATPKALLFDLDGTLVDTAADLARAVNRIRNEQGLQAVPLKQLRPFASAGARGMLGAGLGMSAADARYENLRQTFLNYYAQDLHVDSCLFDGISDLLIALKRISIQWGIVTNKPGKLTEPLIRALNLIECAHNTEINSAACVISGDTTPHAKPHPEPLLEAARRLSILPEQCWYLGDDLRDIQAGKAAGMATLAVTWGYGELEKIPDWQADVTLDHPHQLLDLLS